MAGLRAANRYAKGLAQFANEAGQSELVYNEMKDVKTILTDSADLRSFLASPVFDVKRKQAVAREVFKSFSAPIQKFIALTINHGRENLLSQIADAYVRQYDLANKIVTAEVTSAVALDQATLDKIISQAKQSLDANASVKIVNKIDPSLIGGFVLRVGNQQIDTSIKTKLATLRKEFSKNEFIPKF